ncbi:MAG: hypothetical protein QXF26_03520 [Candidatus Bathyarchaeia archaeon]
MNKRGLLGLYETTIRNIARRLYLKLHGRDPAYECRLVNEVMNSGRLNNAHGKFLQDILLYSIRNVPYYRDSIGFLREIILEEHEFVSSDVFCKIPMLERNVIRRNFRRLLSRDYAKRRPYIMSTSGSTGEPLRVVLDAIYDRWISATVEYYYSKMVGIDFNRVRKIFLLSNVPAQGTKSLKARLHEEANNMIRLKCGELSRELLADCVKTLNTHKPLLLHGNASTLYELSKFIERSNINHHNPKVIVSTGEVLHEFMRGKIESVFSRKVYDFYGAREVSGIAGECSEGAMHIFTFNNHFEIENSGNCEGDVVLTPLHNYSMPLLRYRIGDQVTAKLNRCKCGSPLPALRKIVGRSLDYFVTEDKRLIHGAIFIRLLRNEQLVETFRVVQEDVNKVRILVVMKRADPDWIRHVETEIKRLMGENCKVIWDFLNEIPSSAGGKHLYVQSLLRQ